MATEHPLANLIPCPFTPAAGTIVCRWCGVHHLNEGGYCSDYCAGEALRCKSEIELLNRKLEERE